MHLGTSLRAREEVPVVLILGLCTLVAAGAARALVALSGGGHPFPFFCPFRALTGFPCPTCGGTRALAALARGNLPESLAMNPLLSLAALAVLAAAGTSLARRIAARPAIRLLLSPRDHRILRIGCVVALAANWVYLVFHLER